MLTFQGKIKATVMIDNIDPETEKQIRSIINHPAFTCDIVIMPDCHAGKGCVIGFTQPLGNNVVPNIVGVDLCCGLDVWKYPIKTSNVDFFKLDEFIKKHIPMGFNVRSNSVLKTDSELYEKINNVLFNIYKNDHHKACETLARATKSIGTMGGNNHFCEVEKDEDDNLYMSVHTGSRNFGKLIAEHYQRLAVQFCKDMGIYIADDQAYLAIELEGADYIRDMKVAQEFASLNRATIENVIAEYFSINHGAEPIEKIECVHNYINFNDNMIRKGAISAHKGEKVVIPLTMKSGIILGTGKGNPDWNESSPHGAGRVMSRGDAKRNLKLNDYQSCMEGIYNSTICQDTIDEAPAAYKPPQVIIDAIKDTVEIDKIIKPVYVIKSQKKE